MYHTYGKKDNARTRLNSLADTWVSGEYKADMRLFTDADTIDERLGDKPIITQEYVDINGGWVRCCFFPVEKNEIGRNIRVICGLRHITAEKEKQESQDNLIKALSLTYENVYAVNMDTAEAVCYRMGQTMIARYGQEFADGNYDLNIRMYIENDVFADDRYLFDKIRSIQDVKALLADKQTYSFTYRVFRNNTAQYFECQLVKPDSKRNEFAVGFKNINDEKKQELAQQKKIEEQLRIIGALSQEYHSLFKIDANTGKIALYCTDGVGIDIQALRQLMEPGGYDEVLTKYIDSYIVPEDRERIKSSTGLDILAERVPENGLYKLGYRRNMDGVISYYEMNLVKTVDDKGMVTYYGSARR